jgi:hypothetical protein
MFIAEITGETDTKVKVSRIGQQVQVLRAATDKKVWIKTPEGKEIVWHISKLKIKKKEG